MRALRRARVRPGRPYPLGASWDGRGVNFALFSSVAERVELCLFDETGRRELERVALPEYRDEVWHGYLDDAHLGTVYGFRVYGPYEPPKGHRCNPNKLLLDPYARALRGRLRWSDALFGYRVGSARADLSFDRRDSAPAMPKAVVVDDGFAWGDDRPPATPLRDSVVYELHVRGYTMLHPGVPPRLRGTFAGLGTSDIIAYIRSLGVNMVELLPVHAFIDDRALVARGLSNYWGYNTLGFFAPEPRYLATGDNAEMRTFVSRCHDAGLEVILDVVYNHTAEGNHLGPTLSFRGIDNAAYYVPSAEDPRYGFDATGCGNTVNVSHPRVLQLVMDSLRHWVQSYHIDGFRFDLASALGRGPAGFDPRSGFFDVLRQDPVLSRVKLIAEPWDTGPDGYRLGGFPAGWSEWNDRYRDAVRAFWRGDRSTLPELATRITGSSDLFDRAGRRPTSSVVFVTSHDGFTLRDLVSYEAKHNEDNGEDNQDGHDHNLSANHGAEGPTDDPAVRALRLRQMRNLLATLLLSQGLPMVLAGDERGRTQGGNNNAYCQDNETSWLDWSEDEEAESLTSFVKRLIAFRRAHPVLRRTRFLHGREKSAEGVPDIVWIGPDGAPMTPEAWHEPKAHAVGLMLNGRAGDYVAPDGSQLDDDVLLILINGGAKPVRFKLPAFANATRWRHALDTAKPDEIGLIGGARLAVGAEVAQPERSIGVYVLVHADRSTGLP